MADAASHQALQPAEVATSPQDDESLQISLLFYIADELVRAATSKTDKIPKRPPCRTPSGSTLCQERWGKGCILAILVDLEFD